MILTKQQREEFKEAAKPLIKWLNENAPHPHVKVIVEVDRAEYVEESCAIKCEEFIKD